MSSPLYPDLSTEWRERSGFQPLVAMRTSDFVRRRRPGGNRRGQRGPDGWKTPKRPMQQWGPASAALVAAIILVTQNTAPVSLGFLSLSMTFPLWVMLGAFAAIGGLIVWWMRTGT